MSQGTRQAAWTALALALVALGALVWADVPAATAVALVAIVAAQGVGGVLALRVFGPVRLDAFGLLGLGLALGTALSLLAGVVLGGTGLRTWAWALPPVVLVVVWLLRRGGRSEPIAPIGREALVAAIVSGVAALGSFVIAVGSYPLEWTGTWTRYHPDMFYFEALGASSAQFGTAAEIFMPGADVKYHWFAYAWNGQLSAVAGAVPFASLTRMLMLVAMASGVLIAISWASRASKRRWVPLLAGLLLIVGGNLGTVYGGVFNVDSPSQSVTTIWLLAAVYLLVLFLDDVGVGDAWHRPQVLGTLTFIGVLIACLVGGKVSMAFVALAGVLAVALVGVLRREAYAKRAVAVAVVAVVVAGGVFAAVLLGAAGSGGGLGFFDAIDRSSSQQGLNPVEGVVGVALGTAVLVLSVIVRWAGLGYLVALPVRRWQPQTIIGVGIAVAGAGALVVFNGLNEIWFAVGASAPLAVLTAVGVGEAVERIEPSARRQWRVVFWSAVAAAAVYLVVWKLWVTGASGGNVWVSTLRWTGPVVGVALAAVLGALIAWVFAGGRRPVRIVAGFVIVAVLATVPGRLLGVGTGQIGVQPGLRSDLFSAAQPSAYPGVDVFESSEIAWGFVVAAAWLREHSDADDLVVTNRTYSAIVPAFTHRQTFVSGMRYLAGYATAGQMDEAVEREQLVRAFVEAPSVATLEPLCAAGARWAFVDRAAGMAVPGVEASWGGTGTVTYENEDAVVVELSCG